MSVAQADSTLAQIKTNVRRLTASPDTSSLSESDLEEYINDFYHNDFPYGIKLDQTRSVYSFFTSPNVDRYPLDVNNNQGVRGAVYVEGRNANLFKDRYQFYNVWPRYPAFYQTSIGSSGSITGATQANPCVITSAGHGLATGDSVLITDVGGMTELNGSTYTITVLTSSTFSLDSVDSSAYTAYTSGGTWYEAPVTLSFTIAPKPFFSTMVVFGGTDYQGNPVKVVDDGGNGTTQGNLLLLTSNDVGNQVPAIPDTSPIPSTTPSNSIGTVDYVTGEVAITFDTPFEIGTSLDVWVSPYQSGFPYNVLFWNNEFQVRPVPDKVYKIEVETYLSPTQFLSDTDNPGLKQWAQYLSLGAAIRILRDRQDLEGVQNLMPFFERQEALTLERQGVEEINQRNPTIFTQTYPAPGYGYGQWGY